jgi:hypothetical protein
MNAATRACASSGVTWNGIDWVKVQRQVRRLQARIVKATQAGKHNKAKALQWLLTHSFSGKALAVKRVTANQQFRALLKSQRNGSLLINSEHTPPSPARLESAVFHYQCCVDCVNS